MPRKTKEKPSEDNSHEQNVQISLETVLGGKTITRKIKKTVEDIRVENFCVFINALEQVDTREYILTADFGLDFNIYNTPYVDAVNSLMNMIYSSDQRKIIDFYLYERFDDNGNIMSLVNSENKQVTLQSPIDLYEFLKVVK